MISAVTIVSKLHRGLNEAHQALHQRVQAMRNGRCLIDEFALPLGVQAEASYVH